MRKKSRTNCLKASTIICIHALGHLRYPQSFGIDVKSTVLYFSVTTRLHTGNHKHYLVLTNNRAVSAKVETSQEISSVQLGHCSALSFSLVAHKHRLERDDVFHALSVEHGALRFASTYFGLIFVSYDRVICHYVEI